MSPESLQGGVRPYALTDHIHEREAGHHLSRLLPLPPDSSLSKFKIAFTPVVASWFSGIVSTASIPLREPLRASEIRDIYEKRYWGEKLIRIKNEVPGLGDIQDMHGFTLGPCQVSSDGERVVVVVRPSFFWEGEGMFSSIHLLGWSRQFAERCSYSMSSGTFGLYLALDVILTNWSAESKSCSWI